MEKFYQTYIEEFNAPPTSILEIGSRDGHDADTLRLLAKLPPESVYIAEAHPDCARFIRNTYPNVNLYNVAVFDKMGVLDFNAIDYYRFNQGYVGTSSLLKRNIEIIPAEMVEIVQDQAKNIVKVIGITGQMLLQLIDRRFIDMMKLDVEGATYEVLKSFGDDLRLINFMHVECEVMYMWENQHLFDEVENLLQFYGFREMYREQNYPQQIDTVWRRLD